MLFSSPSHETLFFSLGTPTYDLLRGYVQELRHEKLASSPSPLRFTLVVGNTVTLYGSRLRLRVANASKKNQPYGVENRNTRLPGAVLDKSHSVKAAISSVEQAARCVEFERCVAKAVADEAS